MERKLRFPSPALVIAVIALFVALSGTAVAAGIVPLAKRALTADNAKKLQGKTAAQIAAAPGPASSASALVSVKSAPFSLAPNGGGFFAATCDAGQRAISGGMTTEQFVLLLDTLPTPDGAGWQVYLGNVSTSQGASGTVYAICLR
jgi:hypothetical protein